MNGDAITGPDARAPQSACKALGFRREPLVSPHLFLKDERRALRRVWRLVRQSARQSRFHWLVSRCRYAAPKLDGLRYRTISVSEKTVAIVGCANKHTAKTGRSASFCAGSSESLVCWVFRLGRAYW